jgi:hypothetical protein
MTCVVCRRTHGEPLSYKAFIAELPDHITPAEAEARCAETSRGVSHVVSTERSRASPSERRYAAYKRERGVQFHRDYWFAHKDDDVVRQQCDPRRLEELMTERAASARNAAATFDVAAVVKEEAVGADGEATHLGGQSSWTVCPGVWWWLNELG